MLPTAERLALRKGKYIRGIPCTDGAIYTRKHIHKGHKHTAYTRSDIRTEIHKWNISAAHKAGAMYTRRHTYKTTYTEETYTRATYTQRNTHKRRYTHKAYIPSNVRSTHRNIYTGDITIYGAYLYMYMEQHMYTQRHTYMGHVNGGHIHEGIHTERYTH